MAQQYGTSNGGPPPELATSPSPARDKSSKGPKGPRVVRVKGIPAGPVDPPKRALLNYIHGQLKADEVEEVKLKATIVHSCESDKLVGLVDFISPRLPSFLSLLWQRNPRKFVAHEVPGFKVDPDDAPDLTFDADFLGFTQLYDPSPPKGEVAEHECISCRVNEPY